MSKVHLVLLVTTVMGLSVGQILFKLAALRMQSVQSLAEQWLLNPFLLAALVVYGLATAFWVALLRELPLQVAYPFVALAFFFVPLLDHLLLDAPIRWQTLMGAMVISLGVWIAVGWK